MGHFYIKRNMLFIGTVRGPLTPDNAVYGGRTGPGRLYSTA